MKKSRLLIPQQDGFIVIALWCRYCAFTADNTNTVELNDEQAVRLQQLATEAENAPESFLDMEDILGELGKNERFAEAFSRWLGRLYQQGTSACLEAYVKSQN